jgi:hypothetical protein
MGMARLKEAVTERSPERQRLAEVIEPHRHARRELKTGEAAVEHASEKIIAAYNALDVFRDTGCTRNVDPTAILLAAISDNRACGADDLERPRVEDREKEKSLLREIET